VKYRTIVADPPWRYRSSDILKRGWHRTASVSTHKPGEAEGQYTTMTNAEIAALPVGEWADKDCALYLWVTNPRMFGERDGSMPPVEIAAGWGFRYVTLLTWVKTGPPGLGFYFRGNTEHVLFCVKGDVKIEPSRRESNVITAQKGRHSAKPDRFYEMVERVSPGPYLELFARRRRYGWDVWGDEAPTEQASQAEMGLSA
jgi:N6-adenosine-specific RNA methylase IME4